MKDSILKEDSDLERKSKNLKIKFEANKEKKKTVIEQFGSIDVRQATVMRRFEEMQEQIC